LRVKLTIRKVLIFIYGEMLTGGIKMKEKIEIAKGDITTFKVDAIVNAANPTLLGGGGVDNAIHSAAGPQLLEECRTLGGCRPGEAKITKGYKLPAKHVIHTVGPIWRGGGHGEDELLAKAYRSCFALAEKHEIKTIAFPSISTGAYRFPLERAVNIALKETKDYLEKGGKLEKIIFVCFSDDVYKTYKRKFEESFR